MVVIGICKYIKTTMVSFKWVNYIVYKLYLNKTVLQTWCVCHHTKYFYKTRIFRKFFCTQGFIFLASILPNPSIFFFNIFLWICNSIIYEYILQHSIIFIGILYLSSLFQELNLLWIKQVKILDHVEFTVQWKSRMTLKK